MKKINKLFAIGFFMLFLVSTTAQNTVIKIGANPTTINASAVLEVESTVKGFLPPRMTTVQRDAINNGLPAEGLVVYNTDTKCLQFFNGSYWYDICTGDMSRTPIDNPTEPILFGPSPLVRTPYPSIRINIKKNEKNK